MFPFDRLIKAIDQQVASGKIGGKVVAQIGSGDYVPGSVEYYRFMEKSAFEEVVRSADCIVSHAGIGSIATAMEARKPMLVLPRLKKYGEHVNDHQLATARKYEELGHVLMAADVEDIPFVLERIKFFVPKRRCVNSSGVAVAIGEFLRDFT